MNKPMIWNGLDVDFWGPLQTLYPRVYRRPVTATWYSGYDVLDTYNFGIEEIPLSVRYDSFCRRLDKAKASALV